MGFFTWLEQSALVNWLLTTTWVYPWVISFHSISMGFLVGVIFMIALRVLGFGKFAIAPLEKFLVVVRIGFAVSLTTGVLLLILDAQRFVTSPTFLTKMALIVIGGLTGLALSRAAFDETRNAPAGSDATPQAKRLAAISLACWIGAIFAGRMTAYLP